MIAIPITPTTPTQRDYLVPAIRALVAAPSAALSAVTAGAMMAAVMGTATRLSHRHL